MPGVFEGLDHLLTISLANNEIVEVVPRQFAGLHLLEELDLSHNHIHALNVDSFYGMPSLQVLDLSYNAISEIPVPICNVGEWGDCTYGCCEQGFECFVKEQGYAQCLRPNTCPMFWDCDVPPHSLDAREQFWRTRDPQSNCSNYGPEADCSDYGCCADGLECYLQEFGGRYRECHATCPDGWYCPGEGCPMSLHEQCDDSSRNCTCREGLECVELSPDFAQCQLPEMALGSCTLDLWESCGQDIGGCCRQGTECVREGPSYSQCRFIGDCPRGWLCEQVQQEVCLLGFYSECQSGCCVDGFECVHPDDSEVESHTPDVDRCLPIDTRVGECDLQPGAACGFGLGCCEDGLACSLRDSYPQCYPKDNCTEPRLKEFETCMLNDESLGCCGEGFKCYILDGTGQCRLEGDCPNGDWGCDDAPAEEGPAEPAPVLEGASDCDVGAYMECTPWKELGCCADGAHCCSVNHWWAMCVPEGHIVPDGYTCEELATPKPPPPQPEGGEDAKPAEIPMRCGAVFDNSGFEATNPDQFGWMQTAAPMPAKLTVIVDPHNAPEGNAYLFVNERRDAEQAPGQFLDASCLVPGTEYELSAMLKLPAAARCFNGTGDCPRAVLQVDGYQYSTLGAMERVVDGEWNELRSTFSLTEGQLREGSQFFVYLQVPAVMDFYLDRVVIRTRSDHAPATTSAATATSSPRLATPAPIEPEAAIDAAGFSCSLMIGEECTPGFALGCCEAGAVCAVADESWGECVSADAACLPGWTCPWHCPAQFRGFVNPSLEASQQPEGWVHAGGRLAVAMWDSPDGKHHLLLENRSHWWDGVGQYLNTSCLAPGVFYQLTAMIKLPWDAVCFSESVDYDLCPQVILEWGPSDDRRYHFLGALYSGSRNEWNALHIAFEFSEEQLADDEVFVKFQVKDIVNIEIDAVNIAPAPEGAQTLTYGMECHQTFLACLPDLLCVRENAEHAECRYECPHEWECAENATAVIAGASADGGSEEEEGAPPGNCSLREWTDCHDVSAGCCEDGLVCYRESDWYSQCLKPGTCPDGWDCTITSLENPPTANDAAFGWLKSLKTLRLKENNISQLEDNAFRGLGQLERLELQYNRISDVSAASFGGLWRLTHLDLSDNKIPSLDWETVSHLLSVEYFGLFYNPLNCLPLFPSTVRYQGVSFEQASSLSGCLPRGCPGHVGELVSGWSAPQNGKNPLIVEGVRAIEVAMGLMRPDVRRRVDEGNRHAGVYVYKGAGQRCWCMGAERCFDVGVF